MKRDTSFIFRQLSQIRGYIDPLDALIFHTLLRGQTEDGLRGGLAEIGVFYGRSYFLLRKLAQPGEKVLAIDLFDIGPEGGGPSRQMAEFVRGGARLGLPIDPSLVLAGDSTRLRPEDVLGRVGLVRFFSIDGGHGLAHVQADSALATSCLTEAGIIAFDDSFNPEWPEVTVGLIDFLRAHRDTHAAFCLSNKKTYVSRREHAETYRQRIAASGHLHAFEAGDLRFLGDPAVRLHHPVGKRLIYEVLARTGAGSLSERVYL